MRTILDKNLVASKRVRMLVEMFGPEAAWLFARTVTTDCDEEGRGIIDPGSYGDDPALKRYDQTEMGAILTEMANLGLICYYDAEVAGVNRLCYFVPRHFLSYTPTNPMPSTIPLPPLANLVQYRATYLSGLSQLYFRMVNSGMKRYDKQVVRERAGRIAAVLGSADSVRAPTRDPSGVLTTIHGEIMVEDFDSIQEVVAALKAGVEMPIPLQAQCLYTLFWKYEFAVAGLTMKLNLNAIKQWLERGNKWLGWNVELHDLLEAAQNYRVYAEKHPGEKPENCVKFYGSRCGGGAKGALWLQYLNGGQK